MKIFLSLQRCNYKDVIPRFIRCVQQPHSRIAIPCTTYGQRFYSNIENIIPKTKYTPRRSVLYVPGNDERKIKKVTSLDVDCVVLDCEDGVAMNRKVINIHDLLLGL